jgi:putative CocE/NonD family hydrolase
MSLDFSIVSTTAMRTLSQRVRFFEITLALFWFVFAAFAQGQEIVIERDVAAPMRDGTILRADVYRPAKGGPYPVLVCRTPYGKQGFKFQNYAKGGNIAIGQDTRGRYKSDGEFESFVRAETHDAEDGFDTVEWAAKLPGSNGKVATFGASYNAFLQWRLAPLRPPSLVAMSASSIPAHYTDLEGPGAIRPERRLTWWFSTMSPDLRRRSGGVLPHTSAEALKLWNAGESNRILNFLPRLELPDSMFGAEADTVKSWLRHPERDPWQLDKGCRNIAVPNLDIVGWFDHCNGSMALHHAMIRDGKTEVARRNQRLIVGPWNHSGRGARKVGDFDFGPEAVFNTQQAEIRWFDYWLKGKSNGVNSDAPVKIFVMGANHWRDESEWPPKRAEKKTFFLTSGGHANTPAGDGKLVTSMPQQSQTDRYDYDPRDPVPTLGKGSFTVPADQKPLANRKDILVYQTEPLPAAIEVTGYPELIAYASSSAPDTDFFARLIDVWPDGKTLDVASGMVRARYRDALDTPKLLEPNQITKFTIQFRPTSNEFKAGHRIRLDLTSSDFPNYERNTNTAGGANIDAMLTVAHQTIYHGESNASQLILPVIPAIGVENAAR